MMTFMQRFFGEIFGFVVSETGASVNTVRENNWDAKLTFANLGDKIVDVLN
jgi:hypothetical protein